MKKIQFLSIIVILLLTSCCNYEANEVMLIPEPQHLLVKNSAFVFDKDIVIYFNGDDLKLQAEYFKGLINKTFDIDVKVEESKELKKGINLILNAKDNTLETEGYNLEVEKKRIIIKANSEAGTFYGLQTVFQLLLSGNNPDGNAGKIVIPTLEIVDKPLFPYRGMHLDVCRHMFPVEFIKKYIDLLAFYKFNTFHWHLTEDQGWRIEIKKYPKLTEVGAWRNETLVGHYRDKPVKYDGKKYGGYYTQDEVREVVAYAAERQITVIPEIEMPGHSLAALTSYPELGCTGGPYEVATTWGVFEDIYCTKDETFEFLQNVLLEVMDMFPSTYIHIGGDEAPKVRWKECSICQGVIEKEGLNDEHELQSYFIQRIEKFLNSHGREIIGWDEILEGGLAPNATVMSWRGTEGGIEAVKQGHDAIMTPGSHCYFDHYQVDRENEPLAIGGHTTLEKIYSYQPVPESLTIEEASHILGAQGNVWTEYMETPDYVEYMILPRMAALSEVNWSEKKNWEVFKNKISNHFLYYKKLGYNYCDHPFEKGKYKN